jgi:hypothetical protein
VDLQDEAGHTLITAYAVKRPDGEWSLLLINKDPSNEHKVKIEFANGEKTAVLKFAGDVEVVTFGAGEYVWHPAGSESFAEPDGPAKRTRVKLVDGAGVVLPKASVTVVRGKLE